MSDDMVRRDNVITVNQLEEMQALISLERSIEITFEQAIRYRVNMQQDIEERKKEWWKEMSVIYSLEPDKNYTLNQKNRSINEKEVEDG